MEDIKSDGLWRGLMVFHSSIHLWQNVHGWHEPGCWLNRSRTLYTKRIGSSYTTRRKRANEERSAYGYRTVPRSMLGFIRSRMDWWFDGTTPTKNSKLLRRELAFSFGCFFPASHEFCRSGSELYPGYLCYNARSVIINHYWVAVTTTSQHFQGVVVGALLNMPLSDRLGLGNVSF